MTPWTRAAGAGAAIALGLVLMLALACSEQAPSDGPATRADGAPVRIVSINPCTDAILRDIAAPHQIAAISQYSQDSRATSVPIEWAMRYPAVSENAEDVIAMRPDLVIASTYAPAQTVLTLRRLGIEMLQFDAPDNVAQSEAQIEAIAAHIGRPEQGRALVDRIERAVRQASVQSVATRPKALVWQENGLVLGFDSLTGDLLARTGFGSAAATLNIRQWGVIQLEDLLMNPPDIVMTGKDNIDGGDIPGGMRILSHPALRVAQQHMAIADLPPHLLRCGGPSIIPTVKRLSDIRADWRKVRRL